MAEVDFVLRLEDEVIAIEVKTGTATVGTLPRNFHAFLAKYKCRRAIYLNKDTFGLNDRNAATVLYVPLHWFLLYGLELIGTSGST